MERRDEVDSPESQTSKAVDYATAPSNGTFFRYRMPGEAPYVEVGSTVRRSDPLCVIEAMKLTKTVKAEFDCIIEKVLVEHGSQVEPGAKLFKVRRI
jgi:biotin carboxyl carrier protein